MLHNLIAEFLSTGLMILFGVGVHCDEVLTNTKYHGSGHIFAITTWAFGISVCLYIFGGAEKAIFCRWSASAPDCRRRAERQMRRRRWGACNLERPRMRCRAHRV